MSSEDNSTTGGGDSAAAAQSIVQRACPMYDLSITPQHILAAHQLRLEAQTRMTREPIFCSVMRKARDATAAAPVSPHSTASATLVAAASSGAMASLKAQLATIRSAASSTAKSSGGGSQFAESVPASTQSETRIRGSLSFDAATPPAKSTGGGEGTHPAAAVTVDYRPLNAAAFIARRDQVIADAGLPVHCAEQEQDDGNAGYAVLEAHVPLRADASAEDVALLREAIQFAFPRRDQPSGPRTIAHASDSFSVRVVDGDGAKALVLTACRIAHNGRKDPLGMVLAEALSKIPCALAEAVGWPTARSGFPLAPEMLRLATARIELAQDPVRFAQTAALAEGGSLIELLEGARVAFSIVARNQISRIVEPEILAAVSSRDFGREKLGELIASYQALSLGGLTQASVDIKMAPPAVAMGIAVQEAAQCLRRMHETEVQHAEELLRSAQDQRRAAQWVLGSGPEEAVAAGIAALGVAPAVDAALLRGVLTSAAASLPAYVAERLANDPEKLRAAFKSNSNDFVPYYLARAANLLLKCGADVASLRAVLPSGETTVRFEGKGALTFNLVRAVLGSSLQEAIDRAIPFALASDEDLRDVTASYSSGYDEHYRGANLISVRDFRRGHDYRNWVATRQQMSLLVSAMQLADASFMSSLRYNGAPALVQPVTARASVFKVVVVCDPLDETDSWHLLLKHLGVRCLTPQLDEAKRLEEERGRKKSMSNGGDESDSSEDDSDDELGLLSGDLLPQRGAGLFRAAYVTIDGRHVQFVRPILCSQSNDDRGGGGSMSAKPNFALGLLGGANAVVVINDAALEALDATISASGSRSEGAAMTAMASKRAPVLFVATGGTKPPSGDWLAWPAPNAVDHVVLPEGDDAAEAAKRMMSWLVTHAENPQHGTAAAQPNSCFDVAPADDPIMIA